MRVISNVRALLMYIGVYIFIKIFRKNDFTDNSNIWFINEKLDEARDNGYSFYEYMEKLNNNDCIEVRYLIIKGTVDSKKIKDENVIYVGTLKHIYYLLISDVLITSQSLPYYGSQQLFKKLKFLHKGNQKKIWLQHGVIKDRIPYATMKYSHNYYDMVSCTNYLEKEFISKYYDYPENVLKVVGLCRYDNLLDVNKNCRNILIMPTYRKWLSKLSVIDFEKTDFFKKYLLLLNDAKLLKLLEKENIKIVFYPHYALQKYIDSFKKALVCSDNVILASKEKHDVQELLKMCQILITDYSSVAFDFAYQKKPVIYYQFDGEKYASGHYGQGYFCYDKDGFGPVVHNTNELISFVIDYEKNGMSGIYQEKVDHFFEYRDTKNCERTYSSILKLLEK
ncbi:CDP-glycerol glycerophosphotransferase family protein [Enterococcus sp. AZ196]|uniref:CDP-glycerol glycerophosphotransferase family protein n=1 Tax=Enterococcus sp. AZ196 TaxID=2774659 RepID=UPI003D28A0D7